MSSLQLNNLTFEYQSNQPVLDSVNLTIPANHFSLLVGPSGSGKSTLLKILVGLLPNFGGHLTDGEIDIFNEPLKEALQEHQLALMFQNPNQQFTMDTPRNELVFALENLNVNPAEMDNRIKRALAFCEISDLADRTLVTLSGGEKQKVALALIVAMDCPIILLDEPFASVDPTSRATLFSKLTQLRDNYGKTILLADHDLHDYSQVVDDVFELDESTKTISALTKDQAARLFQNFDRSQSNETLSLPGDEDDPVLKLTDLRLTRQDQSLLSQHSFQFYKNKTTLITGANGIGKSTLFLVLTKLLKYQGQIMLNETDITKIRPKKYARQVGLIFQDAEDQFLKITVAEEIELSLNRPHNQYFDREQVDEILQKLDLTDHLQQVVYSLSEGQKKKLQILLMLITGQHVLLLDEPLKGLDLNSVEIILGLMMQIKQASNLTIIMISHQLTGLANFVDYHVQFSNQQLQYREALS